MTNSIRLIQLAAAGARRIGLVESDQKIHLLRGFESIYGMASAALAEGAGLAQKVSDSLSDEYLDYDTIYAGNPLWRILPSIDHPEEPARCMVSGTGLSHMRSASSRQAMHADTGQVTDSMRMYQWGVEGGRPERDKIGVPPEWFYKGTGRMLRAHREPLEVPPYAEDGGEEPEIAGVYVIDREGVPRRIGMVAGNEFSDHIFEKKNYLNLAGSKLRTCAIGPELLVDPAFGAVSGEVAIVRGGNVIWSKPLHTGESAMCHSLANLEHHHFKFAGHRRPGDVHVHFFGADAFSFGEGIRLADGDLMRIGFEGFGRPLINPIRIDTSPDARITVRPV